MPGPPAVVGYWAAANLVLASVMFGFGENAWFIGLYFAATLPVLVLALIAARSERRRPDPPERYQLGQRAGLMLPLAVGIFMIGFGFVYLRWITIVGAVLTIGAALALLRRPATAPPGDDEQVLPYLHRQRLHPPPPPPEVRRRRTPLAVGLALATVAWGALTRRARRRSGRGSGDRAAGTG